MVKYDSKQVKNALKKAFPYRCKHPATHALELLIAHANSCDAEDYHVKALLNIWLKET